jgi:sulfopyruvate decarboxylase subunit beta
MNKTTAIRTVIEATTDHPIIFTTGYCCRIAKAIADRPSHFYMIGSMGLASSIGIGVALATGRTTVVVDGDGSLLMNPVGLITAGAADDLPLVHIVLDDGIYASTGGQRTPSRRTDLGGLAAAAGYPVVWGVDSGEDFAALVRSAIADCSAPVFIRCGLNAPDEPIAGRIDYDLGLHARRFSDQLTG